MIRKDCWDVNRPCSLICRTPELIENYEKAINDKTQIYICHHRNEQYYTSEDLIDLGLYYDCPPCELIFVTRKEHGQLHKTCAEHQLQYKRQSESLKGRKVSEETKSKLRHPKTKEHAQHISEGRKGLFTGFWYNNGIKNIKVYDETNVPFGFKKGRLMDWKKGEKRNGR